MITFYTGSMENIENKTNNEQDTITISRAEYENLVRENEWFREQLLNMKRKQFGSSAEVTDEEVYVQMSLLFDEAEVIANKEPEKPAAEVKGYTRQNRSGSVRDIVPEDIKVVEIEHDLPEEDRTCPQCGEIMEIIGSDVRETLVIPQNEPYIQRDIYFTYGCANCKENDVSTPIVKTPKDPALIPGGFASPEAVAHIAYQKFVMHAPLYRQEMDWNRRKIMLSRQTMANWMIRCANDWLSPLYQALKQELIHNHDLLHADETTVQVLHEPGKTPQSKSYMWLYRTSGDTDQHIVLYEYRPGRGDQYPEAFLNGYEGYLQTDGYQSYTGLPGVINVGCFAHLRRYFIEAQTAMPKGKRSATADQGVAYCDQLFKLERDFQDLSPEERKQQRELHSKPVLAAMWTWAENRNAAPKSKLGKALTYLKNQWPYLNNYLLDGRIEISNNRAERSIKPFVMSRKNFLFANTQKGADASAVIFSIIETAKENQLDPYRYLVWVLSSAPKLSDDNPEWACELLPWKAPGSCKT